MATSNPHTEAGSDALAQMGATDATVLDTDGAAQLTVPGGSMLLTADLSREGPDLVIEGSDGEQVLVRDYFTTEEPPALLTEGGAILPADLITMLVGSLAPQQYAAAGEVAGIQPIGTIQTLQGTVTVVRSDGSRVTLQQGDPVYQGDVIETAGDGAIGMTFTDGTIFSLGEEGRMVLDELIYDPESEEGTSAFSVVQGVFSFVSGSIAKSGSDAMTVRTPVATIGVRGTMVAVKAGAEGEENVITLLEEDGGITGEIVITNAAGSQVLNVANQTITVNSFFVAPSSPVTLPQSQIDQLYSGAVSILRYLEHEDAEENAAGREGARGEERAEAIAEAEDEEAVAEEEADSELEIAEEGAEPVMDEAELANEAAEFELAEAAIETELEAATAETVETEPAAEDGEAGVAPEAIAQAAENALIAGASEEQVALAEAAAEAALADAEAGGEDPASAAMQAFGMVLSGEATVDQYVTTAAGETGDDSDFGPITPVTISRTVSGPQVAESGLSSLEVPTVSAVTEAATAPTVSATTTTTTPTADLTASAPALQTTAVQGSEDTALPLSIAASLTDADASEELSVTVRGMPVGATLSAGTENDDGSWTLTSGQLDGLELVPPANASGSFTLTITATATESASGAQASTFTSLPVSIVGTADAPVLNAEPASGVEDTAIPIAIKAALVDVDTSETLSLVVNGVPIGGTLSAGTDNGDGSWTLAPEDLTDLKLVPPANTSGTYTLTVSATATETDTGDTATTIATIPVSILAVADAPVLSAAPAAGIEDTAIPLTIEAGLADTDASEVLSITITGLPTGATLSAGTDNADGSWTLMPGELAGLALIPAANASGTFTLTVSVTASEIATGDTATSVATVPINITGVADAPVLSAEPAAGLEDTAIALIVDAGLTDTDASEVLSVTVSGVPAGALLTAGTDNGDGSWTLTPDQLAGLQLIPPTNVSGSFSLIVSATATETATGDTATSVATLPVSVAGVADAPILSAEPAAGLEDTTIPLTIEAGLFDIDASEGLSLTISGMPAGFTLSTGALDASDFLVYDEFDPGSAGTTASFVFDTSSNALYYDEGGTGEGYTLVVALDEGVIDLDDIKITT